MFMHAAYYAFCYFFYGTPSLKNCGRKYIWFSGMLVTKNNDLKGYVLHL